MVKEISKELDIKNFESMDLNEYLELILIQDDQQVTTN